MHINRENKCIKKVDSIKYTDEQLTKYSLIPYNEKIINYNYDNYNNYNFCINKTTNEYINELKNIYSTKRKVCKFCNKIFTKIKLLELHTLECVKIIDNQNKNDNKNIPNTIIKNNTINNIDNSVNIINNIQINIELPEKQLISFYDDWNLDHIDKNTKKLLFMSTLKYTKTLEHILSNSVNNNVLVDSETNTGIIYKGGETDKFETMKLQDISEKSLVKLYNHLKFFCKDLKETNGTDYALSTEQIIHNETLLDTKFNNFYTNKDIKKIVEDSFTSVFNKRKNQTIEQYKQISTDFVKAIGY
jgi:hypothetical protein